MDNITKEQLQKEKPTEGEQNIPESKQTDIEKKETSEQSEQQRAARESKETDIQAPNESASAQEEEKPKLKIPGREKKKKVAPPPSRDEITIKIEKILEEDLKDSYERLSPIAKQEFKVKGEQTAIKIKELMKSSRVKAKKILKLILDWLKMIPGVNKFFLEQEAKIKAEKIIGLKNNNNS